MNQEQLRTFLDHEGVPRGWYCLEGERSGYEATCIERVDGGWEVFFMERGSRVVLGKYETEDEACDFIAAQMLKTLSESSPVPPEVLGKGGST